MSNALSHENLIGVRFITWARSFWVNLLAKEKNIKRSLVQFTVFVNNLIDFLNFFYRNCFNYDSHCSCLWTLHSGGPCKSDWLLLVLACYHVHLAVLTGLDWSTSFGLEQIHTGNSWVRLLSGLEVKRPQRYLLCASFFPWLSSGTCWDHGLLLWPYSACSKNGKLVQIRLLLM